MRQKRIIPCLDIYKGRVVKGVNFVDLKDAGDPVEIAKKYNEAGADEIVFLDISATHEKRSTMLDTIGKAAKQVSIPLTIGGGIGSIEHIQTLLDIGASKVSMNSAAVKTPELIEQAAKKFGGARITVAIDVKKVEDNYKVFINGGRVNTGLDAIEWAKQVQRLGAGEILLTSMDCDGTKAGYDIEITRQISSCVKIPVIASGGAGSREHFLQALTEGGADGALAAGLFHFNEINIMELKEYLAANGVNVKI
ncbi:MAG: imidazole glycerol phosphate synthase subunit HisF [Christensenellales bacterium]|jgi:cyclase